VILDETVRARAALPISRMIEYAGQRVKRA